MASPNIKDIVAKSACFDIDPAVRPQVELYLLALLAGLPTNRTGVEDIVAASKCFNVPPEVREQVRLYLLYQDGLP